MVFSFSFFRAFVFGFFAVFFWSYAGYAQNPSFQDCLGAIPVCQQIYVETNAPAGNGNVFDFRAGDNCLLGENNSIWYTFTVNKSGDFGFLLTPTNSDQDYDWILFDITNANCTDIQNDLSLVVSCNAAGNAECEGPTGATGASSYNNQGPNCGTEPPTDNAGFSPFNDFVPVEQGNTYALCIINFSADLSEGYTLDFGLSAEIGIFDETPPFLTEASYLASCNGQKIKIRFSEFIQCATISEANLELSGTDGLYDITLSSANCEAGGYYDKEFELQVSPSIPFGDSLTLQLIVDGVSEALDLCGNPAGPGSINFGGPTLSQGVDFGPDTTLCAGEMFVLNSDLPGSYAWSDGSFGGSLKVSETGIYWVNINTPCGATSDTIEVTFLGTSEPILGNDTTICPSGTIELNASVPGSSYLWEDGSADPIRTINQPGTYSVTVSNECGEEEDEIMVSLSEAITAEIRDTSLCSGASFLYDVSTPNAAYLWQDGSTDATFLATVPGNYGVTITTACESAELSAVITGTAGEIANIDLGNDTTLCPGESLMLEVAVPPGALLVWQDGSANSSFLVSQAGTYSLTVSNECGEAQDEIVVDFAAPIVAGVADTSICSGEIVSWDVTTPGATYLWQDGSTDATFLTDVPGNYGVTITTACESAELSAVITGTAGEIANIDLGNDTTLCPGESLMLEVAVPPGASLVWQDGSANSSFLVSQAGTYSLTVGNECGEAQDEIVVDFAAPIVAGVADTSICSGEIVSWDVTTPGATYLWQDGSTDATFLTDVPGNYGVTITTACESAELSAVITGTAGEIANIDLGNDTTLCPGESLMLEVVAPPGASLVWQDGSTNSSFLVSQAGTYSLTVSNECEVKSSEVEVTETGPIVFNAVLDAILCPPGNNIVLDAGAANADYYIWTGNVEGPTFTINEPGQYSVSIGNDCEELTQTFEVTECEQCNVYTPNAISPNGDGINDYFQLFSSCSVESYQLKVFNRWGDFIYETQNIDDQWDGTYKNQKVNTGVYVYFIQLQVMEDGIIKDIALSGDVSVIR